MKNLPVGEALYALLAIIGGAARYLSDYLKGKAFKIRHFLAHLVVSGFSGYVFGHLSSLIGLDGSLAVSIAGLGGFMGTRAVELIIKRIEK